MFTILKIKNKKVNKKKIKANKSNFGNLSIEGNPYILMDEAMGVNEITQEVHVK